MPVFISSSGQAFPDGEPEDGEVIVYDRARRRGMPRHIDNVQTPVRVHRLMHAVWQADYEIPQLPIIYFNTNEAGLVHQLRRRYGIEPDSHWNGWVVVDAGEGADETLDTQAHAWLAQRLPRARRFGYDSPNVAAHGFAVSVWPNWTPAQATARLAAAQATGKPVVAFINGRNTNDAHFTDAQLWNRAALVADRGLPICFWNDDHQKWRDGNAAILAEIAASGLPPMEYLSRQHRRWLAILRAGQTGMAVT